MIQMLCRITRRGAVGGVALALMMPACGGAATSGVAVGKVGRDLSARADSVPQGAEVCALQAALAAPAAGAEKPMSEACDKALTSDQLWRRSMIVLAAYSETLETMASDTSSDTTGQLEAALTGVRGVDWIQVEDGPEKAARNAAAQLVNQMGTNTSEGDLEKAVKDAAPHVKTLCDGLTAYLDTQTQSLADIQKEAEKKRTTRNDRRCGSLDNRSICVSESVLDRIVYANVLGHGATLESNHWEARNAVASFCAAHRKLEEASANGELSAEKTYVAVIDAVKSARRAQPQGESGAGGTQAPAREAAPDGKAPAPQKN